MLNAVSNSLFVYNAFHTVTIAVFSGFTFSYLMSFGMAFLVATYIVFVVNERACKAKQSQFLTGISSINFWLSTFLWDAVCYIVPSILILVIILAFQTTAYSTKDLIG
jgi:ATP-binding cassette subfamily A (ABC1) protein 3